MSVFKAPNVSYPLIYEIFGERPKGMDMRFYVQAICGHEKDIEGNRFIPLAVVKAPNRAVDTAL